MASTSAKWALVTGATGGLGQAFCHNLARRGYNIVVTARSEEALAALADTLRSAHGVEVVADAADLSQPGAARQLKAALERRGITVDALVNNAGYGCHGRFISHTVEDELGMIDVNIRALTELCHLFAADMVKRGGGHILLVASAAAFQPIPGYAVYAATKAYVLSLGYSLREELRRKNIKVSVLSPGPTETGFWSRAGHTLNPLVGSFMMDAQPVAEAGLEALFSGRAGVVPGIANKLSVLTSRIFPRSLLAKGAAYVMSRQK